MDKTLKQALDESRLLILGAQVLFGFAFEGVFQEEFSFLPTLSQALHCASLVLMLCSIGLLVAPSMIHQVVYGGRVCRDMLAVATTCAGISLAPLIVSLGLSIFVTLDRATGAAIAIFAAVALTTIAAGLLYGWGEWIRRRKEAAPMPTEDSTDISVKIDHMLTEARVMLPGAQALLGFQFVATLTRAFDALPSTAKWAHAGGLCAVALATTLLMTTAALHRLGYGGREDPQFFRIGSRLVTFASIPLALGVASDVFVVFLKVSERASLALWVAGGAFLALMTLWLALPLAWRARLAARRRG